MADVAKLADECLKAAGALRAIIASLEELEGKDLAAAQEDVGSYTTVTRGEGMADSLKAVGDHLARYAKAKGWGLESVVDALVDQ